MKKLESSFPKLENFCPLSSSRMWHISCPNTNSNVYKLWRSVGQLAWDPSEASTTIRQQRSLKAQNPKKCSNHFLGIRVPYGKNSGTISSLIMGLCCDSKAFVVLILSHLANLTRNPLTSNTNHIFSLWWATMLGEVRILWWKNSISFWRILK